MESNLAIGEFECATGWKNTNDDIDAKDREGKFCGLRSRAWQMAHPGERRLYFGWHLEPYWGTSGWCRGPESLVAAHDPFRCQAGGIARFDPDKA